MSDKEPLVACIALCLIDDKFHEVKRYLEDICEEEWELSTDEVENIHNQLRDEKIVNLKKFEKFTNNVQQNEKEYYFRLFVDLAEIDGFLHEKEIFLLDNLQKNLGY